MIPKPSILETHFGKYMVWPNDQALFNRLIHTHLGGADEKLVQLSKGIIEVSKNKVVLDIGANIGSYSIPIALKLPEVKFYCFEVQRMVYFQLCGNIFLNSLDNIFAHNLAVGQKNAFIDIPIINNYANVANVGGYSIDEFSLKNSRTDFPEKLLKANKTEKMAMRSIDSMSELPPAGLIKIDVEGCELEVLQGAVNYLKRSEFPPIFFESWEYEWYREKKEALFRFLNSIGYKNISNESGDSNYFAQSSDSGSVYLTFEKNAVTGITKVVRHLRNNQV